MSGNKLEKPAMETRPPTRASHLQRSGCVRIGLLFFIFLAWSVSKSLLAEAESPLQGHDKLNRDVELRGRVVCLPEEMHRLHGAHLPASHAHVYGFKTLEGVFYTLLRTKNSEAFFADERIRRKELIVKGRVFPNSNVLDATPLRTVVDGVVFDLYYYCEICSIKTVIPGECMCCQEPVVLMVKPVGSLD